MPTRPLAHQARYLLFYKPYGVLSTFTDPSGRAHVGQFVPVPGVYAAGRLDQDSEGLMLLTDDGEMIHRLTHPRYKLPKTYLVQIENVPDSAGLEALRRGVLIKGEVTAPAEVALLAGEPELPARPAPVRERATIPTAWLRITLHEGRKRQIRHMTAAIGCPTLRLVRVAIGPLALEGLAPGQWRDLTEAEVRGLRRAAAEACTADAKARRRAEAPAPSPALREAGQEARRGLRGPGRFTRRRRRS